MRHSVGAFGEQDPPHPAGAAGGIEPPDQVGRIGHRHALPHISHPVQRNEKLDVIDWANDEVPFRLANARADLRAKPCPDPVVIIQGIENIGVTDGLREAAPAKGTTIRHRVVEILNEHVMPGKLADEHAQDRVLALQPLVGGARTRLDPRPEKLSERRLPDNRETAPAHPHVRQPADDLAVARDGSRVPIPGSDGVEPPWLLEQRVRAGGDVAVLRRNDCLRRPGPPRTSTGNQIRRPAESYRRPAPAPPERPRFLPRPEREYHRPAGL